MKLAEHLMNAILGLSYSPLAYCPEGIFPYHFFTAKTGCNRIAVAKAAACSYRLLPLNTLIN
jgi:hypothetical protein